MSTKEDLKAAAARKGIDYIRDGMVVGLGSGTTVKHFIELLGTRVREGLRVRAIPTSKAAAGLAASLGIPLITFDQQDTIDVTVDGADEIGPGLTLIKGGGGALLHEKIVAYASKQVVIVADASKKVDLLGRFPLPVEVVQFAAAPVKRKLERLHANPQLRLDPDGSPYITDEGNFIFDCHYGRIPDPSSVAREIRSIPGVVEQGLFLGLASIAILAGESGIQILNP